ncbi:TrmH family RNA methyltransferase [Tenacibaculum sp. SG-28]|uniref:TrmH family RNA methyltransferase n=1 Tax=Tenacibaculum sp. SG-28 TaxID=754426 RepID=UPI000CF3C2F7|nr:TrmH family RNA methyltransferase [Tenacibaculum sp. SG-28]PQJ19951.1 rRNA methyltransferase [Tenacibaculum sp. SG-28]
MKQLTHYDIQNETIKFPITIVCDALRTPENIGMCFRISESFGVAKIYLHESSPNSSNRIVKKTARNTLHQISCETYTNFASLITKLRQDGNTIIGIEITDESISIKDYDFSLHEKIVLILGSERHGINDVDVTDKTVSIPMYGQNSSMNVIHSLSIALYEITNQLIKIKI